MIREFFAPRLILFFVCVFGLLWTGLFLAIKATPAQRLGWLTHARAPAAAAAASLLLTVAAAAFLQKFN
jgi:hypothetical protein